MLYVECHAGNKHVVSKDEMNAFHTMEMENKTITGRLRSMTKSVDLHMELLRRSEGEVTVLRKKNDELTQANLKLNKDFEKFQKDQG